MGEIDIHSVHGLTHRLSELASVPLVSSLWYISLPDHIQALEPFPPHLSISTSHTLMTIDIKHPQQLGRRGNINFLELPIFVFVGIEVRNECVCEFLVCQALLVGDAG